MMEWLLNIQQAVKSMQGVVEEAALWWRISAPSLHCSFYFSSTGVWKESCLSLPLSLFFFCHSFILVP